MWLFIEVDGYRPPYRQNFESDDERRRVEERRSILVSKAKEIISKRGLKLLEGDLLVFILCEFSGTPKPDADNVIGGILNALEDIVFLNDKQVKSINYHERISGEDRYCVLIAEI